MEEKNTGADSAQAEAAPPGPLHSLETSALQSVDGVTDEPSQESAKATEEVAVAMPGYLWLDWIRQAWRAGTLRSVQGLPDGPGAWTMLLLIAGAAAISSGAARLQVDGPASFDVRSWLFGWAPAALLLFGVWFVLNKAREKTTHASPVAAWYLLFSIATLPLTVVGALVILALRKYLPQWWAADSWIAWTIYVALWVWIVLTTWRVSRAVTRSTRVAWSLVLYAFIAQVLGHWQLQTQEWQPVEPPYDDDEIASFELSQEDFEAQQALLQDRLHTITASAGSERQTYAVIYAPYDQDVFLHESEVVQQVLEERFGAQGHIVRLVNNSATAAEIPWATTLNLKRSLQTVAKAMNTERDVLVLYLTSHGGADFKLAAQNWPLEVKDLTADELRSMLDELNIRHRVIAVSACYSGGWIDPLKNDDTLIMTAADKDHTSYGCGSKSDLTYFGRAVFDEQLRKTRSFEEAFKAAIPVIKQREIEGKKKDGFSNPQIFVGSNIRVVLDELTQREISSATVEGHVASGK